MCVTICLHLLQMFLLLQHPSKHLSETMCMQTETCMLKQCKRFFSSNNSKFTCFKCLKVHLMYMPCTSAAHFVVCVCVGRACVVPKDAMFNGLVTQLETRKAKQKLHHITPHEAHPNSTCDALHTSPRHTR